MCADFDNNEAVAQDWNSEWAGEWLQKHLRAQLEMKWEPEESDRRRRVSDRLDAILVNVQQDVDDSDRNWRRNPSPHDEESRSLSS